MMSAQFQEEQKKKILAEFLHGGATHTTGHQLKQFAQSAGQSGVSENQIKQLIMEKNLKRQTTFISELKGGMQTIDRNFTADQNHIARVKTIVGSIDPAGVTQKPCP